MNKLRRRGIGSSVTKTSSPNNQSLLVELKNSKCISHFFLVGISIHNVAILDPMIKILYVHVSNAAQNHNVDSNQLVKKMINCC